MWGKLNWNQFWDGASSGRAHLPNARKIANLAISQETTKLETWFLTLKVAATPLLYPI